MIISGLFIMTNPTNIFADPSDDNPGKAKGCENSQSKKDKTKENNPHCVPSCDLNDPLADCDGDGILNGVDLCPETHVGPLTQSEDDKDGDGHKNKDHVIRL